MLGLTSWVGRCFAILIMLAVCGRGSPAQRQPAMSSSPTSRQKLKPPSCAVIMIGRLICTRRNCNRNPTTPH